MASEKKRNITWKEMKKQKVLIIWSLIIVVYGVIFCYLPLAGWMMAFQNYKPKDGLFHSAFIGLAKFKQLFPSSAYHFQGPRVYIRNRHPVRNHSRLAYIFPQVCSDTGRPAS